MSGVDFDDVPNWRGRDVIDQQGHAVGVITDLYVDHVTGRPEWAAVKTGLFSHRVTFVPLSQAALHGINVQVPFAANHIHEAPNIEPHGRLSADEEARLYEHYGLDYAPVTTGTTPASGADSEFIVPLTDKVDEAEEAAVGTGDGRRLRRHEAAEQDQDGTRGG
jgi:hypothetical protein